MTENDELLIKSVAAIQIAVHDLGELSKSIDDFEELNKTLGPDYVKRQINETRGKLEAALIVCEVAP